MPLPDGLLGGDGREGGGGYVLGVDGGATKTVAAVLRRADRRAFGALAGPSNPDAVGAEAATAAVKTAIAEALSAAEVDGGRVDAAVLALAGTSTDELRPELAGAFGLRSVQLVNDVVGAWAAGTGGRPGIAAISGTGSHVFGVNERRETWKCGGWGHVLGDEGSGYWLGRRALRAALAYRDGSGPPTSVLQAALDEYGLERIELLPDLVYGQPLSKSEIAAFTARVAAQAEAGDAVAVELFEQAARDLARQVGGVVRELGFGEAPFPVAMVGSVFRSGAVLVEPFARAVSALAPRAELRLPHLPSIAGPLVLALLTEGAWQPADEAWLGEALEAVRSSGVA
jgi:N-acetylglucosamine kinase-like BadF-type ATPase